MRRLTVRLTTVATAGLGLLGQGLLTAPGAGAATTAAAAAPHVTNLAGSYTAPWQVAVRGNRVLVTDGDQLRQTGRSRPIATGPRGGELRGVAIDARGGYAYATSTGDHSQTRLRIVPVSGPAVVADLSGYERAHNPDGRVQYGVPNASACVRAAFKALDGGPAGYTGRVASHPLAVANSGSSWYVADGAANAVLRVTAAGVVSTVAVLPRQAYRFSARIAAGLGMPSCVAGVVYEAEPTPTDVEVGPDGALYVTVLPALYDLGEGGSVYRVDPATGHAARLVAGLAGAVHAAVTVERCRLRGGTPRRADPGLALGKAGAVPHAGERRRARGLGTKLFASALPTVVMGVRTRAGRVVRID